MTRLWEILKTRIPYGRTQVYVSLLVLMSFTLSGCGSKDFTSQENIQESASQGEEAENATLKIGLIPPYTAPRTMQIDAPDMYFPEYYANRTFGCCAPEHLGTDYAGEPLTPVFALTPGVILPPPISGPHCNFGNVVVVWTKLLSGKEFTVTYGHLSGRPGFEPLQQGIVFPGTLLGYIAHNGGASPAGARCGTDDENGDGNPHVHIGMRMGHPPTNGNDALTWVYYGYTGHGEETEPHGGAWTDIEEAANCYGTPAGLFANERWVSPESDLLHEAYCAFGGWEELGEVAGIGAREQNAYVWYGAICQDFAKNSLRSESETTICVNRNRNQAFPVQGAFLKAFRTMEGPRSLGPPSSPRTERFENGAPLHEQHFEYGKFIEQDDVISIYLNDRLAYMFVNGTLESLESDNETSASGNNSSSNSSSGSEPRAESGRSADSEASSTSGNTQANASGSTSASASTNASGEVENASDETDEVLCMNYLPNILINGEFNYDPLDCGWALEDHVGGALFRNMCDGARCKGFLEAGISGEIWQTQGYQLVPIEAGRRYRVSFMAASGEPSGFHLLLMKHTEPWNDYGLNTWVTTTTRERSYAFEFVATTSDWNARLTFGVGQSTTSFWLDHVKLEELP